MWSHTLVSGYAQHKCVKQPPLREGYNYYNNDYNLFHFTLGDITNFGIGSLLESSSSLPCLELLLSRDLFPSCQQKVMVANQVSAMACSEHTTATVPVDIWDGHHHFHYQILRSLHTHCPLLQIHSCLHVPSSKDPKVVVFKLTMFYSWLTTPQNATNVHLACSYN